MGGVTVAWKPLPTEPLSAATVTSLASRSAPVRGLQSQARPCHLAGLVTAGPSPLLQTGRQPKEGQATWGWPGREMEKDRERYILHRNHSFAFIFVHTAGLRTGVGGCFSWFHVQNKYIVLLVKYCISTHTSTCIDACCDCPTEKKYSVWIGR